MISVVLAGLAFAILAFGFVAIGGVNVAADQPHGWLTYNLLHFAFNRGVGLRASAVIPPADLAAPSRIKLGAQHFHMVCSNCHGGPGLGQSPVALSMRPQPQTLPAVLDQFTDADLFWIVKHGVKFSAMPSWTNQTRDDEVWSMVAFLKQLRGMSAQTYLDMLVPEVSPPGAPVLPFKGPVVMRDADTRRNAYPRDEYLFAAPAIGFGDQALSIDPVAVCSRCHGVDGTGSATGGESPNLTIQNSDYLSKALRSYADGGRKSGFMQPIASQLSDEQIDRLGAWYAGLPQRSVVEPEVEAQAMDRGRKIALEGLKTFAAPACATCHESKGGERIGAPRINGQSDTYLRRQLTTMRDGDRGTTGGWNPMPAVAHYLTDSDIGAVSAYYAAQAPSPRAGPLPDGPATLAAADPAPGAAIFGKICVTCHTRDARGDEQGDFPNITIQTPSYVEHALLAYRAGARENVKMREVAQNLQEEEIASLAAYLNTLAARDGRAPIDKAATARGVAIARDGIVERGVPACLGCHDAPTTAALPLIPRLQGQNAHYLRGQLDHFAALSPSQVNAFNPMPGIAIGLTDQERSDVASYFAAQAPVARTPAVN